MGRSDQRPDGGGLEAGRGSSPVGSIVAICAGRGHGEAKRRVGQAQLAKNFGLSGDCDAGPGGRQLALVPLSAHLDRHPDDPARSFGSLGENLVVADLDFQNLQPGASLRCGDALIRLSRTDPDGGPLYHAKVVLGGIVTEGDLIFLD